MPGDELLEHAAGNAGELASELAGAAAAAATEAARSVADSAARVDAAAQQLGKSIESKSGVPVAVWITAAVVLVILAALLLNARDAGRAAH